MTQPSNKRGILRRPGWFIVIVIVGIVVAWFLFRPRPTPVGMAQAALRAVQEFITEDGTTRLPTTYPIDMPVSGTLLRLPFDVGAQVTSGQSIARVDPYDLQQQIQGVYASIEQVQAQIQGVDVNKPKSEQIEAARVRVKSAADAEAMAKKQLDAGQINLQNAEKEYNRLKTLSEQGGVSRSQLDEAERRYRTLQQEADRLKIGVDSAKKSRETAELDLQALIGSISDNEYMRTAHQAEIANLQTRLAALQNDLAKTDVKSPIDGVILERYTEGGVVMPAGSRIMVLGNLADVEVESDILSEEIPKITVGGAAEISGKALQDTVLPATVKQIYPRGFKKISALGIEQQRVKVILSFDNTQVLLRPGTRVDVRVITAQKTEALAIPERALFRREDQWMVFSVRNGRAILTPVTVGLRNDQWAEILQGLQAGESVITEPTNNIQPRTRVKPAQE